MASSVRWRLVLCGMDWLKFEVTGSSIAGGHNTQCFCRIRFQTYPNVEFPCPLLIGVLLGGHTQTSIFGLGGKL